MGDPTEKTIYRVLIKDTVYDVQVWGTHPYYSVDSVITCNCGVRPWVGGKGNPMFTLTVDRETLLPKAA